jgi:hypothetical protein
MIASAQIAMTRFSGPGRSIVCRAKSLVVSTLFELNLSLPDPNFPTDDRIHPSKMQPAWVVLFSLAHSVPILSSQSPSTAHIYKELMHVTRQSKLGLPD